MSHVFISYAREDLSAAERLAAILRDATIEVWWDNSIRLGRDFNTEIDHALDSAKCVIVIWSCRSVGSTWVRAEATAASERNVLLPIRLDDCRPSTVFRVFNTLDLPILAEPFPAEAVARLIAEIRTFPEVPARPGFENRHSPLGAPSADDPVRAGDWPSWRSPVADLLRIRVTVDLPDELDRDPSRTVRFAYSAQQKDWAFRDFVDVSLQLVEDVVGDVTSSTVTTRHLDLGRLLFELLLPRGLKDAVGGAGALEFELDALSAAIPWEYLAASSADRAEIRPLVLEVPLVRRLLSVAPSSRGLGSIGAQNAIVFGNLVAGGPFPAMPGAHDEAVAVSEVLTNAGLDVTSVIHDVEGAGPGWRFLLTSLYARPYSILHVASLSSIWDDERNRGLPIGKLDGTQELVFLTGPMIAQLPGPPRFAMFNCGNDARMLPPSATKITDAALHESLVYQLLTSGTEVYVGPAWNVNDVAAKQFAHKLYEELLRGSMLGHAILSARKALSEDLEHSEGMYGAYHCYGDSSWTLLAHTA